MAAVTQSHLYVVFLRTMRPVSLRHFGSIRVRLLVERMLLNSPRFGTFTA